MVTMTMWEQPRVNASRGRIVYWRAFLLVSLLIPVVGGFDEITDIMDSREPGHTGKRAEANVEPIHQVVAATAHFRESIQAAPGDPSNYVQLMHALFLDDQRAELAGWMLRYEMLFPERTNSYTFQFNLAMTLYGLYRHNEALERFVRCLSAPPPLEKENMMLAGYEWRERAFHHIGLLLERAGEPMHAARAYFTTVRLQSADHPKYGMYLVTALLSAGRLHEAAIIHRSLLGIRGARFPRLSQPLGEFQMAPDPTNKVALFNPWLGVLHHAPHPFPAIVEAPSDVGGAAGLWRWSSPVREEMRRQIHRLQFATDVPCSQRHVLVYSLRDAAAGFGAETHGLVLALNLAIQEGRTLVLPRSDAWWYTEKALCPAGGWDCYFEPISDCYLEDTREPRRRQFALREALGVRAFVPASAQARCLEGDGDEVDEGSLILAWRAELSAFLLRPAGGWAGIGVHLPAHAHFATPNVDRSGVGAGGGADGYAGGGATESTMVLSQRVAALKRAVNWPGWSERQSQLGGSNDRETEAGAGVLALHIRRGDRMITRRLVTVAEYLDAAAVVVSKYKVAGVLLCTEDFEVFSAVEEAFRSEERWAGVALLTDRGEARNSVENSHLLSISHDLSMQAYAGTAIANLLLMAQCTHFVGGFGSHFARLAFELALGLGSLQAPPRVVDIPWTST